jgi:hypothetical protein
MYTIPQRLAALAAGVIFPVVRAAAVASTTGSALLFVAEAFG